MTGKTEIMRKLVSATACCILLLLTSCLKEDMSSCPEQIRVYFNINTPEGGDEIDLASVDKMNLYVFNQKGYYLGEYRDDKIIGFTPEEYYIDCSDLLPGKYHFIAWGGKDERFYGTDPVPFVRNITRFEDALLMLRHQNTVSETLHHLFFSELPATVTNVKVQEFHMPLSQMTNTVIIDIVGLSANKGDYIFNIVDSNCEYTFEGEFASQKVPFTYTAPFDRAHHATLNVMRLSADRRTPTLHIINKTTGEKLNLGNYSDNLIDLILSADKNNNFDAKHTYHIRLFLDGGDPTNANLTIEINGWVVRNQDNSLVN
jgi:hypothetical protein